MSLALFFLPFLPSPAYIASFVELLEAITSTSLMAREITPRTATPYEVYAMLVIKSHQR